MPEAVLVREGIVPSVVQLQVNITGKLYLHLLN